MLNENKLNEMLECLTKMMQIKVRVQSSQPYLTFEIQGKEKM